MTNTLQGNFHSYIRSIYGLLILSQVRGLEKEQCRIARYRNHRVFNLRCKKCNVLPKDLNLRVPVPAPRARRLLIRTGRALLNERIAQICRIINAASAKVSDLETSLRSALSPTDYATAVSFSKASAEKVFFKFRSRQKAKFEILSSSCRNVKYRRKYATPYVTNLSNVAFSAHELSVLNKGPKFNVTPRSIPAVDIVASVEQGLFGLPPKTADVLRAKVAGLVFRAKLPAPNLSHDELRAIRSLRDKERSSLMFVPSDKGGGLVALSKEDYDAKVLTLLEDHATYSVAPLLPKHPANKMYDGTVSLLQDLVKNHGLSDDDYKRLYPQTKALPAFYGLPKTHKEGCPLRPIVACISTATYELSRYVAHIISPLVGRSPHHLKDSTTFLEFLKDITLDEDEVLVSFDVTALFTSVPVEEAVAVVRDRLCNDETLAFRTTVSVEGICAALEFCLNFAYRDVIYQHKFGTAMGLTVSMVDATAVYRKPMSCGQYLHFDSYYAYSVIVGVAKLL